MIQYCHSERDGAARFKDITHYFMQQSHTVIMSVTSDEIEMMNADGMWVKVSELLAENSQNPTHLFWSNFLRIFMATLKSNGGTSEDMVVLDPLYFGW